MKVYISNECSKRWAPLDIGELHQVYRRRTHSRTRGKAARLNKPRVVDHADGGHARVKVLGHLGQHLGAAMSGVKTSMMRSGGTLGAPKAPGQFGLDLDGRANWQAIICRPHRSLSDMDLIRVRAVDHRHLEVG